MQLVTLDAFRRSAFRDDSRPNAETVRRWAVRGDIPARKIGAKWFVDVDQLQSEDSDELLMRILRYEPTPTEKA